MKAYENNLDIYESVFKRSVKKQYDYEDFQLRKILIVGNSDNMDKLSSFISKYSTECQSFEYNSNFKWRELQSDIKKAQPDLILIQKQLGISNKDLTFSIGPVLESITQELNILVLILQYEFQYLKI